MYYETRRPSFYIPLVFFYGSGDSAPSHDYDALRESLSRTLSVLYPVAGRQKDEVTIECGDEGADFLRANVTNCDLDGFLRWPKLDLIRQLFPRDPYPAAYDPAQPLLAVQVNRFLCGGTAVAICLWHAIADGSGLVGFLETWSGFNRGAGPAVGDGARFVVDASTVFSPMKFDFSVAISSFAERRAQKREKYIAKRFVFSKKDIERLKDEYATQSEHQRRPTRVEALSAFMWAAVIRAALHANPNLKGHMLTNTVDLRRRLGVTIGCTRWGDRGLDWVAKTNYVPSWQR
ncbi:unnamed protein product [Cuscuta campestris]|uniref:Uncharacterized protein n=1 Tax=Cuscuta campestris TaxID=132261 RepID=A0A484N3C3_9ASTE|nr:unnamed protein product [Cuscuta campestris]